jgi:hypothetical protein
LHFDQAARFFVDVPLRHDDPYSKIGRIHIEYRIKRVVLSMPQVFFVVVLRMFIRSLAFCTAMSTCVLKVRWLSNQTPKYRVAGSVSSTRGVPSKTRGMFDMDWTLVLGVKTLVFVFFEAA